ncbi:MAG: aminotransferase class V-fold PLP-dependent enzyme [Acidobacteria bacterium]|nr:aminotransferase class V-fold PLP-dependent enzyme [Acidobacteriota bacterium]
MDDLTRWRDEFPILARSVYMISNSLGAMPRAAARSLAEYADTWATRGVRAWEERWWELANDVGNRVARIIGAPIGSVSMHENVTTASAVALSCLHPDGRRRRIVCTEMDFPSMVYLYRAQEALGFELKIVPALDDLSVPGERIASAVDDRTSVVALSHVLFRSSYIVDPAPVIERAHQVGAVVILDGYQSAGIIPVDVATMGVDFFVGGCLKWLCGGPGNAFLYTAPWIKSERAPGLTGWVAHKRPFEFDIDDGALREDGMGMMNGTPAIPAYYAALPGLDIIQQVGVDRIRDASTSMTRRLLDLVDEYGFSSVASRDPRRLAGTVAVDVPDATRVSRALKARDYVVDYRPGVGIRVSPHFYNTMDEVDAVMRELARIVGDKDYDAGAAPTTLVT